VPKKAKRPEVEIHALIISDAKIRRGCKDFAPEFTLRRANPDPARYPSANWDVAETRNADAWPPDCGQAFREAVARTRSKFDIEWPW
jgi:hypothetical protein